MTNRHLKSLLSLFVACAACSTDDPGHAPSISMLAYGPMAVSVGQQTAITGTLEFVDDDADVATLGIELTLPGGSRQALPLVDIEHAPGQTTDTVSFSLLLVPPRAGEYAFDLWLVDLAGQESNRLTGSLEAQ